MFPFEQILNTFFQCLDHSWYMSVEMQIFLATPLIIYPMWKYGKWGLAATSVYAAASTIAATVETAMFMWPARPGGFRF